MTIHKAQPVTETMEIAMWIILSLITLGFFLLSALVSVILIYLFSPVYAAPN
jgi:hypothetical protein